MSQGPDHYTETKYDPQLDLYYIEEGIRGSWAIVGVTGPFTQAEIRTLHRYHERQMNQQERRIPYPLQTTTHTQIDLASYMSIREGLR